MTAARPYADKMRKVVAHIAHANAEYQHPFLIEREVKRVRLHRGHDRPRPVRWPERQPVPAGAEAASRTGKARKRSSSSPSSAARVSASSSASAHPSLAQLSALGDAHPARRPDRRGQDHARRLQRRRVVSTRSTWPEQRVREPHDAAPKFEQLLPLKPEESDDSSAPLGLHLRARGAGAVDGPAAGRATSSP